MNLIETIELENRDGYRYKIKLSIIAFDNRDISKINTYTQKKFRTFILFLKKIFLINLFYKLIGRRWGESERNYWGGKSPTIIFNPVGLLTFTFYE